MTTATEMLQKYIDAEAAVLEGQSVSFNGRTWTSVNLTEIREGRKEWEAKVKAENMAASNVRTFGSANVSLARF